MRTGDELEGLAEQFNRMSAQLRESYAGLERKVEQRTAELTEALEQQTATAEVLARDQQLVADVEPVFETILEAAQRLFASTSRGVAPGRRGQPAAPRCASRPARRERLERSFPIDPIVGADAASRERSVIHIEDVARDPDVPAGCASSPSRSASAPHSQVVAPMLRTGEPIGAICR